ncbi:BUD13 homolog [Sabethes cyaneus]|uniref:BUD13 homolog n=1 Tax=Sabethes cyaneus TaxID=53552 RepID=UPI00237E3B33|nr:BUD13 homolog [Sabethes cyaneus]
MSFSKTKIDQKEYLKRYLSNDKDKKKKKKKKEKHASGKVNVKIIDDDDVANPHQLQNADESDLFALGEEAPQIVGIIDERPPELKAKEDFNTSKWKKLTVDDEHKGNTRSETYLEKCQKRNPPITSEWESSKRRRDSDASPPRRKADRSPAGRKEPLDGEPKKRYARSSDSDVSPPRRKAGNSSRGIKLEYDSEQSRKASSSNSHRQYTEDRSRSMRRRSDDSPRRSQSGNKHRGYLDHSPPRRGQSSKERSTQRRRDSDESPPRRSQTAASDQIIKKERTVSKSRSRAPDIRHIKQEVVSSDESPPRRRVIDSDESPPRRTERRKPDTPPLVARIKKERDYDSRSEATKSKKMATTLEGKIAGLQDAKAMKIENEKFRRREAEAYENMSAETSGRYAKTVVREKRGKRREDVEEELRKEFEKRKRDEKKKEVYSRWGKGVKQVDEYKARLEEAAHEMNKPLARYADDQDLDEFLKKQDRLGDPMLDYIRSKKKEKTREEGRPEKPTYKGSFMDNRFGIRPGYRWDGVDRSNGFEKKWFEMQSKKKAVEEEAYKYSVEDM